jgi:hypothetical protein
MSSLNYEFTTRLWRWAGPSAWHFLTLPTAAADEIRFFNGSAKGFMPVACMATIGETTWKTSVFPDAKHGSYLLAVKAEVRKKENLRVDDEVTVKLAVRSDV